MFHCLQNALPSLALLEHRNVIPKPMQSEITLLLLFPMTVRAVFPKKLRACFRKRHLSHGGNRERKETKCETKHRHSELK